MGYYGIIQIQIVKQSAYRWIYSKGISIAPKNSETLST